MSAIEGFYSNGLLIFLLCDKLCISFYARMKFKFPSSSLPKTPLSAFSGCFVSSSKDWVCERSFSCSASGGARVVLIERGAQQHVEQLRCSGTAFLTRLIQISSLVRTKKTKR